MRAIYGGLAAQIVTPVAGDGGGVVGIVSVHQLGNPRRWTDAEVEACRKAAASLRRAPLTHNRWHPDLEPIAEVDAGRGGQARDGRRHRRRAHAREHARRRGQAQPRPRAPAHRAALRPGCRARRRPRSRVRRLRDRRLRHHRSDSRLRLPRRSLPRPVPRQVGDRRRRSHGRRSCPASRCRRRRSQASSESPRHTRSWRSSGGERRTLRARGQPVADQLPEAAIPRGGGRWAAHDPAARDRRQPRHPPARRRQPPLAAGCRSRRALLDRRPALRPG